MQNKGFVKVIAVLLTLICLFYFSFSIVTNHYEKKAAAMGEVAGRAYLDSMANERVYVGKTLKECQALQIGLGLDLKGGMNVILEVSVPDVVNSLAGENAKDAAFQKAIAAARQDYKQGKGDFVDCFINRYQEANGKDKLGGLFAAGLKGANITYTSTDNQVKAALDTEVKAAVSNAYQVVRNRVDQFGVAQPNIQILQGRGQIGQIMVEMPGIKEPERVRKLLQGSANLEFWETYNLNEIQGFIASLNNAGNKPAAGDSTTVAADSTKQTAQAQPAAKAPAGKKLNELLITSPNPQYCVVGYADAADTAAVNAILRSDFAKQTLPKDLVFAWGVKAEKAIDAKPRFELYALKGQNGQPYMQGAVIADAKDDFDQYHNPIVSMNMTSDGSRDWAAMTKKNLKRCVAIVLDGNVYSAPTVQTEINGGQTQISGHFTIDDTRDLANVLKSGKMPAPTNIISEETVGPSLGSASITAGVQSAIIAFILLMIFMCCYYGLIPGMVANLALILNFFFTLGVLTSFQAALTMSGIAGMVLTLGMAVDANVLIYERTKEELRGGKGIKQAIASGYGNAFSAIFDSNLTSIITALILYNVGTGPIRGFALTLAIGICASFFTAVWISRIIFEHFVNRDKWQHLTFDTKLSRGLFQNTNFNFIQSAKRAGSIFGILVVAGAISLGVRGLSKGIDFTGGRNFVIEFENKNTTPEEVQAAVAKVINKLDANASVNGLEVSTTQGKSVRLSTNYLIDSDDENADAQVEKAIWQGLYDAKLIQADYDTFKNRDDHTGGSIVSAQKVGASVASEMTKDAILATFLSLIAIFIYILIRFRSVAFSVGSIAALAVDTFLIIGTYSICWGWVPFSLEVDQTFVGAILTAIGYSINDKVVVFDRIRENIGLWPKRETARLFNESINQTLARTLMTSLTTLLVLFCIFILGGDSIRSFAFAMILGVIFGTLSSIFLAAPIANRILGHSRKVVEA